MMPESHASRTPWILLLLIVAVMVAILALLAWRPWLSAEYVPPPALPTASRTALLLDLQFNAGAVGNKLTLTGWQVTHKYAQRLIPGRGEWTVELLGSRGQARYFGVVDPGRRENVDAIGTPGNAIQGQSTAFGWRFSLPVDLVADLEGISRLRVYDKDNVPIGAFLINAALDGTTNAVVTDALPVETLAPTPVLVPASVSDTPPSRGEENVSVTPTSQGSAFVTVTPPTPSTTEVIVTPPSRGPTTR